MIFGTYNVLVPHSNELGDTIVYNTLSKACVALAPNFVDELRQGKIPASFSHEQAAFLKEKLFVLDDRKEERTMARFLMNSRRYGSTALNLVVYTTYNCNLSCPYCYEKESGQLHSGHMTDEIADNLMSWLQSYCDGRSLTDLYLRWYGGEPLANLNRIKTLGRAMVVFCEARGIALHTAIVTNGTLLEKPAIALLNSMNLEQVQITIDGPREIHNARRPYVDGRGTYDKIVSNMVSLLTHTKSPVVLRVNFDEDNISHIAELLQDLWQQEVPRHGQVYLEFAPVWSIGCFDKQPMTDGEIDMLLNLQRLAISLGFRIRNPFNVEQCFSTGIGSFNVDPNGNIFSCPMFADYKELKIGDVQSDAFEPTYYDFATCEPYDATCFDCEYFPICAGGCRFNALLERKDPYAKACHRELLDKNVQPRLRVYYSQPWAR